MQLKLAVIAVLVATAACGKNNEAPASGTPVGNYSGRQESAPKQPTPQTQTAPAGPALLANPNDAPAVAEAKGLFNTVCVTCHGPGGGGDGPAAVNLNPRPQNYKDPQWQQGIKDEDISKAIVMGGAAMGKSPMMPAQPQLKDKPEVVAALVAIIRQFGK
jgi:mono/diheme cytochrome c family protein